VRSRISEEITGRFRASIYICSCVTIVSPPFRSTLSTTPPLSSTMLGYTTIALTLLAVGARREPSFGQRAPRLIDGFTAEATAQYTSVYLPNFDPQAVSMTQVGAVDGTTTFLLVAGTPTASGEETFPSGVTRRPPMFSSAAMRDADEAPQSRTLRAQAQSRGTVAWRATRAATRA
jgi:hypothetical protein